MSNEAQFLHDPTGSRRFMPFEVEKIDIERAHAIDINRVWSQAKFPRKQKQRNGRRSWVYGIIYAEADIYSDRQPTLPGESKDQEKFDF